MIRFFQLAFLPSSTNCALLLLRAWFGLAMLLNHGMGKLQKFDELSSTFADPLGVGPKVSLTLALFGEVVCSILLVLGLFTRFAAAALVINMAVAFFLVHHGKLQGENNGELAFAYLGAYVALLIAGGGAYALDAKLGKSAKSPSAR